jgi:hypothetical protein
MKWTKRVDCHELGRYEMTRWTAEDGPCSAVVEELPHGAFVDFQHGTILVHTRAKSAESGRRFCDRLHAAFAKLEAGK